jgi:hypothetical protein
LDAFVNWADWDWDAALEATPEITPAINWSSEIDLRILDWTMDALGEDDSLENFFAAIPGFFTSRVVKNLHKPLSSMMRSKFVDTLTGFCERTLLSNSVTEEIKTRRLLLCINVTKTICDSHDIERIVDRLMRLHFDQVPQSIQTAQILSCWCTAGETLGSLHARHLLASILLSVRERDNRWIALAKEQLGLSKRILLDSIAHGDDSVLLAIFIHMARQVIRISPSNWKILSKFSEFDIHNTLPGLQNEFCALWNTIVMRARRDNHENEDDESEDDESEDDEIEDGHGHTYINILRDFRPVYIALHQNTDAAPTVFFTSADDNNHVLNDLRSYPLCIISTHHSNCTAHFPTQRDLRQVEGANIVPRLRSSPNYAPSRPQGLTSAPTPQTADQMHIAPQPTSIPGSSIHRFIEVVSQDSSPHLFMEVSRHSQQSALTTVVSLGKPTPDIPINGVGEISQRLPATSLTVSHPDPIPVAMSLSTLPRMPPISVQYPGDVPDTPQHISSTLTFFIPQKETGIRI